MTTKEKHEIEVKKLREIESRLDDLILVYGKEDLVDTYLSFKNQRNVCNELYVDVLKEIVNQKI